MAARSIALLPALPAALLLLTACGGEPEPTVRVEHDTVGDTVIVRTVAGSSWGGEAVLEPEVRIGVFEGEPEYMFGRVVSLAVAPGGAIYAVDRQVPALRKYRPDGTFEMTLGREGEGPGEYQRPDGGLAVLDDGRVVLRDPSNARLQIYSPAGEPGDTWPIRGSFYTSTPLVVDTTGRVYTSALMDPEANVTEWHPGMIGYHPETGEPVDTIPAPRWDYEAPRLVASVENNTSIASVPFSPGDHWAMSPLGYMVGGVSTRYAIDQYRPDGSVLRIERVAEPVPVRPAERSNSEEQARWNMRQTQPDWRWNGPSIPNEKPAFTDIAVGQDGRIWVRVPRPGEPIPEDEIATPDQDGPNPRPTDRWREPIVFDVFEPDGTFLGTVRAPDGFSSSPAPVMRGDRVWAVIRDELDVQYITRFRIARPGEEPGE